MLFPLLHLASANTTVLPDDDAALEWIRYNDDVNRALLPIVGPASLARLQARTRGHVRFVTTPPDADPDAVAREARLSAGSPCALVVAPMEDGWVGWTSGSCGMLTIRGWRVEGHQVVDGTDRAILVPHFARQYGDLDVLRTYRRMERRKTNAIWMGALGSGLLVTSLLAFPDERQTTTRWTVGGAGAALTSAGLLTFGLVHADPRSRPTRIDAYYSATEVEDRVRTHNRRVGLAWSR